MALNVKVALLTCLSFTTGMCWLVSQVARPMVELPAPAVVRAAPAVTQPKRSVRGSVPAVAGRFERPGAPEAAEQRAPLESPDAAARFAKVDEPSADAVARMVAATRGSDTPGRATADQEESLRSASAGRRDTGAGRAVSAPAVPMAVIVSSPPVLARSMRPASPTHTPREDAAAARRGHAERPNAARVFDSYAVQRGDTLAKIARAAWNRDDKRAIRALVAANPKLSRRRNRIYVGETLRIPVSPKVARAVGALPEAVPGGGVAVSQRGPAARAEARGSRRVYTVKRRDTLAAIARRELHNANRWPEIARLNDLKHPDRILPGTRILLPPTESDT